MEHILGVVVKPVAPGQPNQPWFKRCLQKPTANNNQLIFGNFHPDTSVSTLTTRPIEFMDISKVLDKNKIPYTVIHVKETSKNIDEQTSVSYSLKHGARGPVCTRARTETVEYEEVK